MPTIPQSRARRLALIITLAVLACLVWAISRSREASVTAPQAPTARYLVGADYITTYPDSFQSGFLRQKLTPPQRPLLGLYQSADLAIVETHIDWAAQHGIDFFALQYSPRRPPEDLRPQLFGHASNIGDIQFCLSYALRDLGFRADTQEIPITATAAAQLVEDMEEIAETYLGHPQYLKISGRPVILLRESSRLRGQFEGALASARKALLDKGYDVFLIGDEVDWSVDPQPQRLKLFDAVTAHELFRATTQTHSGYGAASTFLEDVLDLSKRYVEATHGAVPVLPKVLPGFNNRGSLDLSVLDGKGQTARGVLPRSWKPGAASIGFMNEMLDRYALPSLDAKTPILLINSWNGWAEDTAIEPLGIAGPTSLDVSGQQLYTEGYPYDGYGLTFLELIRDKVVAISGSVIHKEEGYPLAGVPVAAWRDGEAVAVDLTDSRGRFHLSRLTLKPGEYLVGTAHSESVEVIVGSETTSKVALTSDLTLPVQGQQVKDLAPYFPSLHLGFSDYLAQPPSAKSFPVGARKLYAGPQTGRLRETLESGQEWDPAVAKLLKDQLSPGQTVVEVGANVGVHSLLAAALVGKQGQVYAFESDRRSCRELILNAKLNSVTNLEALWFALGERTGLARGPEGTVVEQRTLDSFHIPKVALLRVDQQALGGDVISGARELLRQSQPTVLLRMSNETQMPHILGVFASVNYRATPVQGTDQLLAVPFGEGPDRALIDLGTPAARKDMEEGFSVDETELSGLNFVWSEGVESLVHLEVSDTRPGDYVLGIRGKAYGPIAPVRTEVLLNGASLGHFEMTGQWTGVELVVPYGLLLQRSNTVLFRYGKMARPAGIIPGSLDNRALSLAIDRVWLAPRGRGLAQP